MFSMGFGLYSSILLVNNYGLDSVRFRFKDDHVTSSLNANNKLKNSTLGGALQSDGGGQSGSDRGGFLVKSASIFLPAWGFSIFRNGFREQPGSTQSLMLRCFGKQAVATGLMNSFEQGVVRGAKDNGLSTETSLLIGALSGACIDPLTSSMSVTKYPALFCLGLIRNLGCVPAVSGVRFHQDDTMDRGIAMGIYGSAKLGDIIGKQVIENNFIMPKLNFIRIGGFLPCVMTYGMLVREGSKMLESQFFVQFNSGSRNK